MIQNVTFPEPKSTGAPADISGAKIEHVRVERRTSKTGVDTGCLLEMKAVNEDETMQKISVHEVKPRAAALIESALQRAGYRVRQHEAGYRLIVREGQPR